MEKKKKTIDYGHFARMTSDAIREDYHIPTEGLTEEQVEQNRETYGANRFDYSERESVWRQAVEAYLTPFTLILIVLAIISFFTDYVLAAPGSKNSFSSTIIVVLVLISGTMSFVQSLRSTKATAELEAMVHVTAAVKRHGKYVEIPTEEIVVGDQVKLAAGDIIPADMRLFQTKDLFISQSAMTGESYPVEKIAKTATGEAKATTDYNNIAFMGSNVVSGSAEGIVIVTGRQTLFGDIARSINANAEPTSFDIGVSKTSHLLIRFMTVMAPAVFLINGISKGNWMDALIFAISVAVGLTPEMLPMIVTANLVKGSATMAKKGTIVRNLNAIQNFGAMDVLCTDKTGTLTQDKIVLEYHMNVDGLEDASVLRHSFLNSYYQTGLKNLLDVAIIEATEKELDFDKDFYHKIDEVPFDFERRRMSVVVEDKNGKRQMITKGAIEEMLSISTYVYYQGKVRNLTDELRSVVMKKVESLNEDGMRVIGVSQKTNPSAVGQFSIKDECEMVLIGFLAFLDPPKESTSGALDALKAHNVAVKVLTGDNEAVTRSVCEQVGLDASTIISGEVLEKMSEAEIGDAVEQHHIFVKLSPNQKAMIARQLRKNGHVVGFMGDGINDSPALTAADIGISVDTAVDIAKESADIILLKKDLMVLEQGVISGRRIFANIMKYIKITVSSNFGNVCSILISSIFLPFLPMLPVQLLLLNLIYDISCMSIPWDNVDDEYIRAPKRWKATDIKDFMVYFGPLSSIFDVITFIVMYNLICPMVFGATYHFIPVTLQESGFEALFHSGWFVVSLWTQTLVLHALRTEKLPFVKSQASFIVTTITSLALVVGTALPYTILGRGIGLERLPHYFYYLLIGVVIGYLFVVTIVKRFYIKRFKQLL